MWVARLIDTSCPTNKKPQKVVSIALKSRWIEVVFTGFRQLECAITSARAFNFPINQVEVSLTMRVNQQSQRPSAAHG